MPKKLTYEFVKEQFENEGYELLSKEYKNNKQKLEYICSNGHEHSISCGNWQKNYRCPYCYGNAKPTIEFIRSEFEKEGYKLLISKYINNEQKLFYICSKGHKHNTSWNSWQRGHRCPFCYGNGKPTIEFVRSEFAKEGYKLLTKKYINAHQKLDYICPKGHKNNTTWNNWFTGYRCSECVITASKGEVELRDFVESLGIKVSPNNRTQIFNPNTGNGLELDIFMPTLSKAVEYNGEYWHKNRKKDLVKQKLCESKGIDLLTIWENKWKTEKNICKDKIKEFIFK
jgi:hypothetical protein